MPFSFFPSNGFLCFGDITHANERRPTCNLAAKRYIIEYSLNGYQHIFSRDSLESHSRSNRATFSATSFLSESFEAHLSPERARIFFSHTINKHKLAQSRARNVSLSHRRPVPRKSFILLPELHALLPPPRRASSRRHCEALRPFNGRRI